MEKNTKPVNNEAVLSIQEPIIRERVSIEERLIHIVKRSVVTEFGIVSRSHFHDTMSLHQALDIAIDNVADGYRNAISMLKNR